MELDLSDRTAIITGAGRGIGEVIATTFAAAGANIVAAARTTAEIDETVEDVEALGVKGLAVPTDMSDPADIDNLVQTAFDVFDSPAILVNNAGANLPNHPFDHTIEEVDTMLDVNLRGF